MMIYTLLTPAVLRTVVSGVLVLVAFLVYRRYRRWEAGFNAFPGKPISHWFFGNLKEFPGLTEEGYNFNVEMVKLFPKFFRFWVGRIYCVLIFQHPDTVKVVLKSSAPKSRASGTLYVPGLRWLGEGLLIANGERWARNRRLLTPAFHFDILQPYTDINNKCVDILLSKLQGFCDRGENFEAFEHIGLCSLDIIGRCAFSYITDAQTQGDKHPYVNAVHRLTELWTKRTLNLFHILDWVYFNFTKDGREFSKLCDYVHKVAEDIIQKRKKVLEIEGLPSNDGNRKRYLDFLDILITAKDEDGVGLCDYDIRCEVDTFMFEAHDTTTSGISYTLLCLAQNQEIQEKVRQEVDDILTGRESDDITWKDLAKFEYLNMCIKEGLRYSSPVHVVQRHTTEELQVEGYTIPSGTNIIVHLYALHHNPAVWGSDFNEYRPERFLHENVEKMDPFAFVPFSGGPRNCIGQNFAMMEMKIMIARIIHRFKIETVPGHIYRKELSVVTRSENGILLKITQRRPKT
ncbi:cytochrome P450 4F2-like isoform X2 [Mercenaria mercenaria]|uniref:cytochrome P450 4F2-like isoform X2 n=1 Tax=Mercenaria mercenaria TaxID=6596 RepID=UPI00234F4B4D|nr:cytochrome P450 4F2-like isoform X2 [Mercenaria mercenaria]